ncbi:UDP-N-acetylenolpyruvoylglucosamine reductase [Candidatus Daviesbacteria bacterium RIFCSPLOWO2_02_FULL_38_18]|uniref:UDP-N-acetylenolpyruvoylglucosamine reductase n=1 Tax=Candidatus Daviesbacteria bacterium GW2011_GWF2_38_6 TaxID=1618432 RepID=A0A0G0NI16_9BACT|nr:MAG: UDP-N-acetylenolpyruvoylglucosamine reductase [Candidatus Daviesbacteria bacterium GW2011_GWA2_38_17]KKQ76741.1 MAG: UDP-N-acetylenolpyruvoylglucosamine reductase [Candidatus Daviesbacteria bacterium GW2011_GWF2_38_6]OGE45383.1 MAG: UDP-N-acetylenolpyruvoylglucosamine reductase [Candidatus Daviesbacteria bacterium RIFCSPHIGHO2_12_FULL_38_25]OGE68127.1 MAG: UDP-N-acetylenolpyruvoylglucosamine reductase [Candidatus Daviesbacteria bacterium RIFCSPLOWO2_02_FULL_38_18]OGE72672.1 MAG: UDP-N-a
MLMSKITTLQIGGPAKDFQIVRSEQELLDLIKKNSDFLIIGGGGNLLVSDEGIDKLVIKNEITGISGDVSVKSGTLLQDLVNYSIEHGLAGLQKLTGIPGTVGGAVYGNAGAYGQTISDYITHAVILSKAKNLKTITKNSCLFSYRDSIFKKKKDIILEVTFQLENAEPAELKKEAEAVLAKRLIKYPLGIKCPGSFFKNIIAETLSKEILEKVSDKIIYGKLPAGTLLEEVGAKGASLDNIYIADYHANLFINKGGGTAKSFYNLAKKYALLVKEKFNITLEPEVQLINLPSL